MAWAEAGAAAIVIVGRNPSTLEMTAKKIAAVGKSTPVLAHPTDVSSESSVKELFERIREKFDKAHVLVNAAGTMSQGMIGDAPLASWWGDFVGGSLPTRGRQCKLNKLTVFRKTTSKGLSYRPNLSSSALVAKAL